MVLVWVEFEGQFAVGLLQVLIGGPSAHPQDLIVIFTLLDPEEGEEHGGAVGNEQAAWGPQL